MDVIIVLFRLLSTSGIVYVICLVHRMNTLLIITGTIAYLFGNSSIH
jgi:hypothetical protein